MAAGQMIVPEAALAGFLRGLDAMVEERGWDRLPSLYHVHLVGLRGWSPPDGAARLRVDEVPGFDEIILLGAQIPFALREMAKSMERHGAPQVIPETLFGFALSTEGQQPERQEIRTLHLATMTGDRGMLVHWRTTGETKVGINKHEGAVIDGLRAMVRASGGKG